MVNLINVVSGMMGSFDLYKNSMKRDIEKKSYYHLCLDAKSLLDSLGEESVEDWELRDNSEELKRGVYALKTLSEQLDHDVIDEDLVKSSYRKFQENCDVFMKELFEFYVMNE